MKNHRANFSLKFILINFREITFRVIFGVKNIVADVERQKKSKNDQHITYFKNQG
jgi:hypothetical protein